MFTFISWGEYITAIVIGLIIYYTYIGLKYFRWEILSLIGVTKTDDNRVVIPSIANQQGVLKTENPEDYLPKPNLEIDISPVIQSFTEEVQAYIYEAKPHVLQPELLYSLQLIASKYSVLKNAVCRDELLQTVLAEVNKKYPGLLEQNDVSSLWK